MEKVDFLIVGQGIAGTLLALKLKAKGQKVKLLDNHKPDTSSKKAGGLYNPITGRHMVKTWMADELFENIQVFYQKLEKDLGGVFHYPKTIYRPFFSVEEQNDWQGKVASEEYSDYIQAIHSQSLKIAGINDPYGGLELKRCGAVDLPEMLRLAKSQFELDNCLMTEAFDYKELKELPKAIQYAGIEATRIIFCEGPDVANNPYFDWLPFKPVKGEVLMVKASLSDERVINRGVFILPKQGFFKVGSTYDHSTLDHKPTEKGRKELIDRLGKIYDGQYEIVDHVAGVRPATFDRRPFIGQHPEHSRILIFNGFGTKGVSLVPFFATQFVNYLLAKGDLAPDVDIRRVL